MVKYGKRARLLSMMALTSVFFLAEIITGYLTNSMALVADSFHMLSDVLSLLIGYMAVLYSGKKSKTNTYDWARAEVLGAMANAVFLMALVFTIVVAAIQRLIIVEEITQPLLVLGVGAAGLLINIVGLFIFGSHAHGHSHGHAHSHEHGHNNHTHEHSENAVEVITGEKDIENGGGNIHTHQRDNGSSGGHMNMQAVFLHVLGDALGSVVVIISALVIYFVQEDWRFYIDPIMSLVTSVLISCTTIPLLRRASMILLQNPPATVNLDAITEQVSKVPGVVSIHDLHIWQLSGSCNIATIHVVLEDSFNFTDVAKQLKQIFHQVDIHSTTIQPEYIGTKTVSKRLPLEGAEGQGIDLGCCDQTGQSSEDEIQHQCNVMLRPEDLPLYLDESRTPSGASPDDDSDSACLLTCLSQDCLQRMCCDGTRHRANLKAHSFNNPNFSESENQAGESTA